MSSQSYDYSKSSNKRNKEDEVIKVCLVCLLKLQEFVKQATLEHLYFDLR